MEIRCQYCNVYMGQDLSDELLDKGTRYSICEECSEVKEFYSIFGVPVPKTKKRKAAKD